MRLTRLYVPDIAFSKGMTVPLSADHAHYVLRVLRMTHEQAIILFNEQSGGWQARLHVEGKKASAVMVEQTQKPTPKSDIGIILSPLKKEAWDFCIEKIAELGVSFIQPAMMDFTQNSRVNDARTKANLIEAAQQCERTDIPRYDAVGKLDDILKNWDASRILYVALERSDAVPALDAFDVAQPAAILVGPEGGFSQRERALFDRYDFIRPVNLGKLILRAETAALAALAIWGSKANSRK